MDSGVLRHAQATGRYYDKALARHPDVVLLHGGSSMGAERIAARWAEAREIAQVVFKPD